MHINLTDEIVSQFLSGAIVVLALIAMGGFLLFVLKSIANSFPFTRMGLALALAPLSLLQFLDYGESTSLLIYSMIAVLLGITIDGLNHLLTPKERMEADQQSIEDMKEEETPEQGPGVFVWEKAE